MIFRVRDIILTYYPVIDSTLYAYLPTIILITANVLIIRRLRRKDKFRQNATLGESSSGRTRKITKMLVSVSLLFLICTGPSCVYEIFVYYVFPGFTTNDLDAFTLIALRFAKYLTEILAFCNHSLNFFLYCLTGQRFRTELKLALSEMREFLKRQKKNELAERPKTVSSNVTDPKDI